MALVEKKQELTQRTGGKPGKAPPSPKEEKKDTSGFGGKPYIPQEKGREWVRRPELFRATGIPEAKRLKIWQEITKDLGYFIEGGEPEKMLERLRMERGRAKTEAERKTIEDKIKLTEKFLGK